MTEPRPLTFAPESMSSAATVFHVFGPSGMIEHVALRRPGEVNWRCFHKWSIYIYIYIYNIYIHTHIYIYVNQFSSINTISTHIIYRNWRCFQWYVLILCWYMKTEKEAPNCAIWRSCSSLQVWRGLLGRLYNDMWHVFLNHLKKTHRIFLQEFPSTKGVVTSVLYRSGQVVHDKLSGFISLYYTPICYLKF